MPQIIDRFFINIVVRHKEKLLDERILRHDTEEIIQEFEAKTGRKVERFTIEREDWKYKLNLEIK